MKHPISLDFEFKETSKHKPDLASFNPKTVPIIIATKNRNANKHIGMINLFLIYQGRLGNVIKSTIQIQSDKDNIRLTSLLDKDVRLYIEKVRFKIND